MTPKTALAQLKALGTAKMRAQNANPQTYAAALLQLLEGTVVSRAYGPDQRVWTVIIGTQLFWLAYDDYPCEVSLDAQTATPRRWSG
jgi:hypothetical protein